MVSKHLQIQRQDVEELIRLQKQQHLTIRCLGLDELERLRGFEAKWEAEVSTLVGHLDVDSLVDALISWDTLTEHQRNKCLDFLQSDVLPLIPREIFHHVVN